MGNDRIIVDESLSYRRDFRTNKQMQDNLRIGYKIQDIIFSILKDVGYKGVTLITANVDANPDITIEDPNLKIEVQDAQGWYRQYPNDLAVHLKANKFNKLSKIKNSFLIQTVGKEIYIIDIRSFPGVGPIKCRPIGDKTGYILFKKHLEKYCEKEGNSILDISKIKQLWKERCGR